MLSPAGTGKLSQPVRLLRRRVPSLIRGLWLPLRVALCLLALAGILLLAYQYKAQGRAVVEQYRALVQEAGQAAVTPESLVSLTHQMCALSTSISSVDSFLQPLTSTLSQGGWCGNYDRVFIVLAQANGYSAHKLHLRSGSRSHTAAEVLYQGQWRVVDPFFNLVYRLPSGEMATFEDLVRDPSLFQRPTFLGRMQDPRLEAIYRSYTPVFPALYRDAPDLDLALNESSLFHGAMVLLSYPLDPLYGGSRRPLLPPWLDRPELLGIYALSLVLWLTGLSLLLTYARRRRARHQAGAPGGT